MAYSIAGNDFSTYNMTVMRCYGAMDFPRRSGEVEHEWNDENGVDVFVDNVDLSWSGRKITLDVLYVGTALDNDVNNFIDTYRGADFSLVTSYGTFTVNLQQVRTKYTYKPNGDAELSLEFWQPAITIASIPTVVGGSGTSIGGYDLLADFGMVVAKVENLSTLPGFTAKARTFGDTPVYLSGTRGIRKFVLHLYGKYSSNANMMSSVANLMAVLCSANLKTFTYHGVSESVYFADGAQVYPTYKANFVTIKVTLRIREAVT